MKRKYKQIEQLLYDYRGNKHEIIDLDIEIERIENDYTGINSISYEERVSSSSSISSLVESEVIAKESKIERLQKRKSELMIQANKIDNALQLLDDVERTVVESKYLKGYQWWQVASEVRFSESYTRNINRKAINKLAERIHL